MNLQDEIWETIRNEVAYLNGGSLDARKGSLAEQAANILTPFVKDLLREVKAEALEETAAELGHLVSIQSPDAAISISVEMWLTARAASLRGGSDV